MVESGFVEDRSFNKYFEMEGRDLGKIKREGYFTGTRANALRFIVIGGIMGASVLFGAFKFYYGSSTHVIFDKVLEWDRQYELRQQRITELEARRVKAIREKLKDDI